MALEDDIATLTVLGQGMLAESGEQAGFDARALLDRWLTGVVPALGSRRPIDVLIEPDGLEVVKSLLLRTQSGAYS
ncbi:antitoxin Xre/MbcA/ParS toxin-binding domain-containing protein [Acidovorax sp. 22279]|uniref:antitoxin Xre/MbcA/ParS toxin-binding domain-containing protein n=1 Tax=Acidovorax sp. 22279 TaxID=3453900 RepID=UPI003F87EEE0